MNTTVINSVRRAEANIKAYQGDTFSPELTFTDANDDPLDFTDVTFKMQIRKKDGTLMQTLIQDTDFTLSDPADDGKIFFGTIIDIEKGVYEYDLQGTWSDDSVVTLLGGQFEVVKEVTV
jgi:hypothetical protein